MATEAQKKAVQKYERENVKKKIVRFFPKDQVLLEHLEKQPSQNAYMIGLIADDMARELGIGEFNRQTDGTLSNGSEWMEYIGYEPDSVEEAWELHVELDGRGVVTRIHADNENEAAIRARRFVAKLRCGWMPVNWQ